MDKSPGPVAANQLVAASLLYRPTLFTGQVQHPGRANWSPIPTVPLADQLVQTPYRPRPSHPRPEIDQLVAPVTVWGNRPHDAPPEFGLARARFPPK